MCDVTATPPTCVPPGSSAIDAAVTVDVDAAIDAPPDAPARTIPSGARLWLQMEDDPTDGAIDSALAHVTTCTPCPTVVTGKSGSAYLFDGTQALQITSAADLTRGTAFTVAVWVRLDAVPTTNGMIASKQTALSNASYALLTQTSSKMGFYSNPGSYAFSTTAFAIGAWHHVAYTWDGATKRGYIDGAEEATAAVTGLVADDTAPFDIGGVPGGALYFKGALDDLVFYDRVLTAAELTSLISGI
jgi:hypothetical protein